MTPGDANGDGRVDINDLTIVLANYGKTGMTWTQGEFTGDGTVDINDLTIVLANFGKTAGSSLAAVSEPSTFVLFALAHHPARLRSAEAGICLLVSRSTSTPLSGVVVAVDCVPQGRAGSSPVSRTCNSSCVCNVRALQTGQKRKECEGLSCFWKE